MSTYDSLNTSPFFATLSSSGCSFWVYLKKIIRSFFRIYRIWKRFIAVAWNLLTNLYTYISYRILYIVYPSSLYLFMYHVYVFVFVYVLPLFVTNTNSASLKMKVEKLIKKNAVQIIPFIQLLRQSSLAYIYIR